MKRVLIVGGVAGGASAAARMRRLDEHAEIVIFERGEYISFANCGLPYYIGGEIAQRSALTLQTPDSFRARFNVDVRVGHEVVGIDRAAKTVAVKNLATGETRAERYDKLILAPGAEPIRPKLPGADSPRVFTLRTIPDTDRIKAFLEQRAPKSAVVVGGGYIGLEMAENLVRAGLAVTVVEMRDQVIAPLDYDMACAVHRHIESHGVRLLLGKGVQSFEERPGGALRVALTEGEVEADLAILSIGVKPDSVLARDAGLALNERGGIVVDALQRTDDPDIYAVGDAVEVVDFVTTQKMLIPLAGPANKQGRIAADHIAGLETRYGGTQGSAILKVFDLTVATTGINEATARRLGLPHDKSVIHPANHAGYYPGATPMTIKTLFDPATGKILGAQIVGFDGVDKRCDVMATAIRAGMTAADLATLELCYAPPYSSAKDPVNMAGFVIENQRAGLVKNIHWHDVDALPRDGSATLLDTRTPLEYGNGHIPGFVNIPLDELRNRLETLPTDKPVYLVCQSGLRSYVAARILTQRGFDAYNLNGGYRLYQSIFVATPTPPPTRPAASAPASSPATGKTIVVDAGGLSCPGPILRLSTALEAAAVGDVVEFAATDPAFAVDGEAFCRRTGHEWLGAESAKGRVVARIRKAGASGGAPVPAASGHGKNFIVFSGDLDKAFAAFVMANAAAAMGRKTALFFTFWGLNILRRPEKVRVRKDFLSRMFGWMMPRGVGKLGLSKMNMGGLGAGMMRGVMKKKNVPGLEEMIDEARRLGVELVACGMSMDVMGIQTEELIDGVKIGGAATMLAHAEESDMSLFI